MIEEERDTEREGQTRACVEGGLIGEGVGRCFLSSAHLVGQ